MRKRLITLGLMLMFQMTSTVHAQDTTSLTIFDTKNMEAHTLKGMPSLPVAVTEPITLYATSTPYEDKIQEAESLTFINKKLYGMSLSQQNANSLTCLDDKTTEIMRTVLQGIVDGSIKNQQPNNEVLVTDSVSSVSEIDSATPDITITETPSTDAAAQTNPPATTVVEIIPSEIAPAETAAPEMAAPEATVPETTPPETTAPETVPPETTPVYTGGLANEGGVSDAIMAYAQSYFNMVPENVRNSFIANGWTLYITTTELNNRFYGGAYTQGVCASTSYDTHCIYVEANEYAISKGLMHEMGHYIDWACNTASFCDEWYLIWYAEKGSFDDCFGIGDGHSTSSAVEFFAAVYNEAILTPSNVQASAPAAYEYVMRCANRL